MTTDNKPRTAATAILRDREAQQAQDNKAVPKNNKEYEPWPEWIGDLIGDEFDTVDVLGIHFAVPYSDIIGRKFVPPTRLSIFTSHYAVHFIGDNLADLHEKFIYHKIRCVQAHNAKNFGPHNGEGHIIRDVKITWFREEFEDEAPSIAEAPNL